MLVFVSGLMRRLMRGHRDTPPFFMPSSRFPRRPGHSKKMQATDTLDGWRDIMGFLMARDDAPHFHFYAELLLDALAYYIARFFSRRRVKAM